MDCRKPKLLPLLLIITFIGAVPVNGRPKRGIWVAHMFGPARVQASVSSRNPEQEVRFTSVSLYSGKKANGAAFSGGTYDSTDGAGVVVTTETYASASRARAEMLRRVKRARRIIEKVRSSWNRSYVGRVVLLELGISRHGDNTYAVVLRLEREELNIIESSSLRLSLAFERQFYPK